MKAMIFAAGIGSRLAPITDKLPKCLVEVGGCSLLEHVVNRLKSVGVTELVINLHYKAEMVQECLAEKNNFGLQIETSYEDQLLGTGGGLNKVRTFFEGTDYFLLHNCDVLSDLDLSKLVEQQRSSSALATLVVKRRETKRYLLGNSQNQLVGWEQVETGKREVVQEGVEKKRFGFSGIHVISPKIFEYMNDQPDNFSIITAYLNAVKAGEQIDLFDSADSFWIDIGSPERLAEARERFAGSVKDSG